MLKRQNNINYFLTDFNRVNFTNKLARIFARMFCARLNKNVTKKTFVQKMRAKKACKNFGKINTRPIF